MSRLTIRHETRYRYDNPVTFGVHRLLVRPRDSHAIRLISASLDLSPPGQTRWVYDALGNCVCLFTPQGASRELRIVSNLVLDRFPGPLKVEDPLTAWPIVYNHSDRLVLDPFIRPSSDDDEPALLEWLKLHLGRPDEPVMDFLYRMNRAIHGAFTYNERQEEGVQTPAQTIALGSGSCRDLAWLMVEALRRLGFAARYIMGYLHCPPNGVGVRGTGATHAWCEVFLPSLGWMEFDPTNGLTESADLIRVATVRNPAEASPVSGHIIGDPGISNLFVSVHVELQSTVSSQAA